MLQTPPELKQRLADRIAADPPGRVWTPSDFVDLASRDAVDKVLQRLTKSGGLRRIDRGLYDQPRLNSLTKKPNPPDPRAVIDAVARRDQLRVLVDGLTAANDLGWSDAVPSKIIVHADARLRPIRLENVTISFRPTAASKLYWAGRPGMRVVQALHWLRDMLGRDGEQDMAQRRLTKLLADPETGQALRADLTSGWSAMPAWMRELLRPMLDAAEIGSGPQRQSTTGDEPHTPDQAPARRSSKPGLGPGRSSARRKATR
ncbi:DUF6088 family protein [Sphingomonas sp. CCH5-D11]|jgi:hypothetical protein|uniref:DUF6088 family protein n=1 Tax=Sphingomonas sp. CCH5-D11 TaxID=1768786 RepID=UPI00082F7B9F|nr:DUF6088 family protein [Sphingomonas sp. CCH5-D11]